MGIPHVDVQVLGNLFLQIPQVAVHAALVVVVRLDDGFSNACILAADLRWKQPAAVREARRTAADHPTQV